MNVLIIILIIFFPLNLIFIAILFVQNKLNIRKSESRHLLKLYQLMKKEDKTLLKNQIEKNPERFIMSFLTLSDKINLSENQMKIFLQSLAETGVSSKIFKWLNSQFPFNKKKGAHLLGKIPLPGAGQILTQALSREKNNSVKIVIINALIDLNFHVALPDIIDTLINAPLSYQTRISKMIRSFGSEIIHYIPMLIMRKEKEIKRMLISYSSSCINLPLFEFLLNIVEENDPVFSSSAFDVLVKNYRKRIPLRSYLYHPDLAIKKRAIEAIGSEKIEGVTDLLISYLPDENLHDTVVLSMTNRIKDFPLSLEIILQYLSETEDKKIRRGLVRIISNRIDYFLFRILSHDKEKIKNMVKLLINENLLSGIISFLNSNHDIEIENEIIDTVKSQLGENEDIKKVFQLYLDERILKKLNLISIEQDKSRSERKNEVPRILLILLLFPLFLFFPFIYLINSGFTINPVEFIFKTNYYFAYYSLIINSIYFLLLFFSFKEIRKIKADRSIKTEGFLMKEGILPTISIIAPAFCEEATIIENVTSLLNLDYPDFEVIVVNDGSTDKTLSVMVDHFDLERIDFFYEKSLKTSRIRGIYKSKDNPKLTLVDKMNGGKADSLNAGINVSKGEYCCGIDADSLLESRSIIEAVEMILDEEQDVAAIGGMILPVNGCSVENGQITRMGVSKSPLPGLQTIEYIRAFISGRLGWSSLNSLLIISGAFGIFNRDQLIKIRGYLTNVEVHERDTVGEDMELVVRMVEHLKKQKKAFSLVYAPFAICWTEVPEAMKVLSSQRNRWQRGLLEIMHMHKSMVFNPRFGNYGILGLPYYFLFEIIGPWLEFQGYLCFFIALAMGILQFNIILLVLMSTILYGIFLSIGSLLISINIRSFFSIKNLFYLLFLAFIENFGYRQIMSIIRIQGYVSMLKRKQTWGVMTRKGFSGKGKS